MTKTGGFMCHNQCVFEALIGDRTLQQKTKARLNSGLPSGESRSACSIQYSIKVEIYFHL